MYLGGGDFDQLFFDFINDLNLELLYLLGDKAGFRLYVKKRCKNLHEDLLEELIERIQEYFDECYGNRKGG